MKKKFVFLATTFALLALASAGCSDSVHYENYDDANLYRVGEAAFSAAQVSAVKVDWVNGDVELTQSLTGEVLAKETESSESEAERMRYYLDGTVLYIKYCKSGFKGSIDGERKSLQLAVPQGVALDIECQSACVTATGEVRLSALSVESVSGNFTAERIVCGENAETEIETTSGKVTIGELTCGELTAETTSGDFSVGRLSVDRLEADTVSGELSFGVYKGLTGEIDSSSGDILLTLQAGLTTEIAFESFSGSMEIAAGIAQVKENNRYYLNGGNASSAACRLEISTFSGNVFAK